MCRLGENIIGINKKSQYLCGLAAVESSFFFDCKEQSKKRLDLIAALFMPENNIWIFGQRSDGSKNKAPCEKGRECQCFIAWKKLYEE